MKKKFYDMTEPEIDHDEVIRILGHVIDYLKDREPVRTLTARKLIMDGLMEFEVKNATIN